MSYLIRQKLLRVIEKTIDYVSSQTMNEYRKVLAVLLSDKIPNIRLLALKIVCGNKKVTDKMVENYLYKLKDDPDSEIKQIMKGVKVWSLIRWPFKLSIYNFPTVKFDIFLLFGPIFTTVGNKLLILGFHTLIKIWKTFFSWSCTLSSWLPIFFPEVSLFLIWLPFQQSIWVWVILLFWFLALTPNFWVYFLLRGSYFNLNFIFLL